MSENKHVNIIKKIPRFSESKIIYLSEWANNIVYDIDDEYIARFWKNKKINMEKENNKQREMLEIIAKHVDFEIPKYVNFEEGKEKNFEIYKKIKGEILDINKLSLLEKNYFLKNFGENMANLHSIDLREISKIIENSGKNKIINIHKKKQEITKIEKELSGILDILDLEKAIEIVEKFTINEDELSLIHWDLTRRHIYVDENSKKLKWIIDFDDVEINDPLCDFSLFDLEDFKTCYLEYGKKKQLVWAEKYIFSKQQAYRIRKILLHIKNRHCNPQRANEILEEYYKKLIIALKDFQFWK